MTNELNRDTKILGIKAKGRSVLVFLAIVIITTVSIAYTKKVNTNDFTYRASLEESLKREKAELDINANLYISNYKLQAQTLLEQIAEAKLNKDATRVQEVQLGFH